MVDERLVARLLCGDAQVRGREVARFYAVCACEGYALPDDDDVRRGSGETDFEAQTCLRLGQSKCYDGCDTGSKDT